MRTLRVAPYDWRLRAALVAAWSTGGVSATDASRAAGCRQAEAAREIETRAATKIQALFRCFYVRRSLKGCAAAALYMQARCECLVLCRLAQ